MAQDIATKAAQEMDQMIAGVMPEDSMVQARVYLQEKVPDAKYDRAVEATENLVEKKDAPPKLVAELVANKI